jgi:glycosyltransferase involved in cell wall biosynthesis
MKFGIIISIYKRPDGNSPAYLKRCILSILNQKYTDYKCFVIGDKYEGDDSEIRNLIPKNFYYENRKEAPERQKYTGKILWHCGGLQSTLYGINLALNEGIDNLILLDYDDYWMSNHLYFLNENFPFAWACTKSTYPKQGREYLPIYKGDLKVVDMLPVYKGVVKSSVCWNHSLIPLLPRNVYEEDKNPNEPSDADLWLRMGKYIKENNLKSIFINELTCYHDTQGYALKTFKTK